MIPLLINAMILTGYATIILIMVIECCRKVRVRRSWKLYVTVVVSCAAIGLMWGCGGGCALASLVLCLIYAIALIGPPVRTFTLLARWKAGLTPKEKWYLLGLSAASMPVLIGAYSVIATLVRICSAMQVCR